ncbi:MAG: leucine-rich repeat protein, partial [Clostridia bacterium]|nr:leucine-rich repeat protein [Clostridia bacterium]
CKSLEELILPEGLTNIGNCFAKGCSALTKLSLPSTLSAWGGGSQHFYGTALTEVIGLENTQITCISYQMFRGVKTWTGDENGVIRLPNTVTQIDGYGLADVQMTTLILGANFEKIAEGNVHSFAGTKNLKYVYAPASTTVLSPGNANFQLIFVTSTDEDALATISATTGISNVITYAQYQKGEYTSGTKYIVSGYNLCDAFYDGHVETEEQISKWTGDKFLSNYKIVCPCGRNCGAETVVKDLAPLFVSKGYSTSGSAMMQAFAINKSLWESEYSELFPELKYGMVAAYKGVNGDFDTTSGKIVNADCTGINTKVAIVDMTERDYDVFEIKISGVGAEDYKATTFFLCAYVVLDGTVYYIDNGTTGESAKGASYNDVEAFVSPEYGYVGKEEE